MKKSFKVVSSLFVGILAVGAGLALTTNNGETKQADAASNTFIVIGDHQVGGWNNTDDNFAMTQRDGQYEFKGIHWTSGQNWRITWAGEFGKYAGWSTLQSKEGMEAGEADNNIKTTREWYYDIYFKNTDSNKIYLANAAYTVTLHKDGGDVVKGDDVTGYSYSDEVDLPKLAKAGYSFDGFYDNSLFTGNPVTKITATDHGNKDFYAKFTEVTETYTVKYSANGGEGTMSDSLGIPDEEFDIPTSAFSLEGYKQTGWSTTIEGEVEYTTTIPANTYEADEEVTLYAVWEEVDEKEYYITNNKNWANVDCHYWGSSSGDSVWPGVECEFAYINESSENVYKVSVPEDVKGIVFNNGDDQKTVNIEGESLTKGAFYLQGDNSPFNVGTWEVKYVTVCYNIEGGTGTQPAEHEVYFHGKGLVVDSGEGLAKGDQVFDKWVSSLKDPIITSYVGDDSRTYIDTTHENLSAGMRIELHALYKDAPMADGYYLVGSMTDWALNPDFIMSFDEEKSEYSLEYTFELDDEFKIYHHTSTVDDAYGYSVLESGDHSAKDAGQIVEGAENSNMKVAYAGTYTPYFKTAGNTIWISAIEETYVYRLDVRHADESIDSYNVVLNEGTEFVTETNVPVESGDTLAFYKNEELQTINPKAIGNNNCYSNEGVTTVLLNMNAKIYVDFANGTCFCDGMTFGEFGLVVNNNYVRMTYNETPADPSFIEWYKQGYSFPEGANIQFVDTTSENNVATIFSVLSITGGSTDGFEVVDSHLVCTADGGKTTDIYVKFKSGADEVYFGDVAEDLQAAINFAKAFNNSIGSVCKVDASTDKTAMQEAWAALGEDFLKLIEKSQEILKDATIGHANDDIKVFAAKYDYVFAKYGTAWSLTNFAGRTPAASSLFTHDLYANNSTSNMIVIICVVSSITLLGSIFLIKRKRKLSK